MIPRNDQKSLGQSPTDPLPPPLKKVAKIVQKISKLNS